MIWKRLFNKTSNAEKGTLYQLKNLLHRTAVPLDPGDNMKAAENFLELVLHAHIVAAAESLSHASRGNVAEMTEAVVSKFVQIVLPTPNKTGIRNQPQESSLIHPQLKNLKTKFFFMQQKW